MKTLRLFAACLLLLAIPPVFVWIHRYSLLGLNPFVNAGVILLLLLLLIPPAIWLFRSLQTPRLGKAVFPPDAWFALGTIVLLFVSMDPFGWERLDTLDIHLHDTYFVIARGHMVLGLAVYFGFVTFVYFGFQRITRRRLNPALGLLHFWISVLAIEYILLPTFPYKGLAGMPRRYMDYSGWKSYHRFVGISAMAGPVGTLLLLAQLLLPLNIILTLVRKRQPAL